MSGAACGVCSRILAPGERVTFRRTGKGVTRREVPTCLLCFRPCVVPGCGGAALPGGEACERCDRAIRWAGGRS